MDTFKNQLMHRFEEATKLHFAAHSLELRLPRYEGKPGNILALKMAMAELVMIADEVLELGIHEWNYDKKKKSGASTVREAATDVAPQVSEHEAFHNDTNTVQEVREVQINNAEAPQGT